MATDIAPPSVRPEDEHEVDVDASRPFAHRAAPRTAEMEAVSRQAAAHLNHGHELAARGAVYSARSEFTKALQMIAQALDLAAAGDRHGTALSAGLRALDEAEDFVPHGTALETDLNLKVLIESHRTPILKDVDLDGLPAIKAQQQYYTYAQEQLGVAAGSEPVGSMALFGLGKLYATFAEQPYSKVVAPLPKAMVYFQAALWTSPGNYMAANELAVLMAGHSRYEPARELLRHSVRLSPHPTTWRNLAAVHRQLGEAELARLADAEAARTAHSPPGGPQAVAGRASSGRPTQPVEWVAPESFARQSTDVNAARLPSAKDRPNAIVPAWKRATLEPGRRG